MHLAILSTTKLPKFLGDDHPDEAALFAEDTRLADAFAGLGVAAERVPWRAETDWAAFDAVLIRSTWDYFDDLPGFFEVLARITDTGCRLINPLATIEWNHDKRYLARLAADGLPVVPSVFVPPGSSGNAALETLGPRPHGYICKPTVGVGGFGTRRARDAAALLAQVAEDNADWQVAQPFLPAIETEGEFSFVFGAGRFLYAAQKVPAVGDYRVQVMYGAETRAIDPAPADLAAAWRCHDALPVAVHLARIDMVRLPDGRLALMEAELIEPQLYFHDIAPAAGLVAGAIAEVLG